MVKGFLHQVYHNWMAVNFHKFIYPPRMIKQTANTLRISFDGLNPNITLYLRHFKDNGQGRCVDAQVSYYSHRFDMDDCLWCGEMLEKRDKQGRYYCAWCLDAQYYSTRDALWHAHIFDDLLAWVNTLNSNQCIVEWSIPPGESWGASICNVGGVANSIRQNDRIIPLIQSSDLAMSNAR